jgi:hypothetical protein
MVDKNNEICTSKFIKIPRALQNQNDVENQQGNNDNNSLNDNSEPSMRKYNKLNHINCKVT